MSNAKHTPGPWWATSKGIRNSGGFICLFVKPIRYPGQDDRFVHETAELEANARLIAAAPELLGALKELLSVSSNPLHLPATKRDAEDKARAAIAKTTGESA